MIFSGIFRYFKYRCHFDIGLHLLTDGNSLKLIRMTSIFNGSISMYDTSNRLKVEIVEHRLTPRF